MEWVASSLLLELEQSLIGGAFPASLRRRLGGCEQGAREDGDDCGEGTHFRSKLWKWWVSFEEGLMGLFDGFELGR